MKTTAISVNHLRKYGENMKIETYENDEAVSKRAAELVEAIITNHQQPVLGLATGSTPLGLYQRLIEKYQANQLSFENVITYNLDEYLGLAKTHPESYHAYMDKNLFSHVNINPKNIHMPDNDANRKQEIVDDYNQALAKHPIDLQILGIGENAHIGFNEPGTPFDQKTFIVELDEQTRQSNARFFDSIDEVPSEAITMGIKQIMAAKQIVLIATGDNKAEAIKKTIKGPVTEDVPASILKTHPNCIILLDKAAAKYV